MRACGRVDVLASKSLAAAPASCEASANAVASIEHTAAPAKETSSERQRAVSHIAAPLGSHVAGSLRDKSLISPPLLSTGTPIHTAPDVGTNVPRACADTEDAADVDTFSLDDCSVHSSSVWT